MKRGGHVIDVQRIIALSQQPRRGTSGGEPASASQTLLILGDLGHADGVLARPIAWSQATCRSPTRRSEAGGSPKELCAACPIDVDCRSALLAGAPAEVQRWRERMDGGRALTT